MTNFAAVVAYSDSDSRFGAAYAEALSALVEVASRVIVVSTSPVADDVKIHDSRISYIERPDVGGDFYSYRVGLTALTIPGDIDGVFLVTTRFILLNRERFVNTLREMSSQPAVPQISAATGITAGVLYVQPYLLFLARPVITSTSFTEFVDSIEPVNTPTERFQRYEVGLSVWAHAAGISLAPILHTPSRRTLFRPLRGFFLSQLPERDPDICGLAPSPRLLGERIGIVTCDSLLSSEGHDWIEALASPQCRPALRHLMLQSRSAENSESPEGSPSQNRLPSIRVIPFNRNPLLRPDVAVVVHAYYVEPLAELRAALSFITEPFDLFITTPHEADVPLLIECLDGCAANLSVVVSENRGRDIGPFMSMLRRGAFTPYSAVLKLHLKQSLYSAKGDTWRRDIFGALCGNALTVSRCIDLLRSEKAGLIGPHSYFLTHPRYWGSNHGKVSTLLSAVGASLSPQRDSLAFFAGSMFWFNPQALEPLVKISEALLAFEAESGAQDGTLAHACERIFAQVTRHAGFHVTSNELLGDDMFNTPCDSNRIPVL